VNGRRRGRLDDHEGHGSIEAEGVLSPPLFRTLERSCSNHSPEEGAHPRQEKGLGSQSGVRHRKMLYARAMA